jgi:transmembrane sensor
MRRETSRQIDHDAAHWAVRTDRGLSAEEEAELGDWLAADPRRHGAFMRMRAIAIHSERAKALGAGFDADAFKAGKDGAGLNVAPPAAADPIASNDDDESQAGRLMPRRRFVWGGGAIAASVVLLAASLTLIPRGQTYETRLGESRVVTLPDGSVMTLNTDTNVNVRFSDAERLIELDHGEALFDVAHNKVRPFVVLTDGARVRAVGTSFTVKKLDGEPLAVMVSDGTVELTRPTIQKPVRIAANNTVTVGARSTAPKPVSISREEVVRETAWKAGRIAFEGESLSEASAEFARYSEIRIVVDDPTVGREEITGLFASNDPVSFAKAAALSLGLKAEVGNGEVRLTR